MKYKMEPCTEADYDFLHIKLAAIDDSIVPTEEGAEDEELVFKILDDEGNIIGGCILNINRWKIAELDILWLDERYRRQGLGSALIREAEKTALERGCRQMFLGTFSFQAKPFYEKHGYVLRGAIKDWPKGQQDYSLSKRLDQYLEEYIPSKNISSGFKVSPGSVEDGKVIFKGLFDYNTNFAPRSHDRIPLNKKLTDEEGNMIAAIFAGVGNWNEGYIDIVWVDEPYRNQGIGSELLTYAEREMKELGAYVILLNAFDWQADLFRKHGYTECVTLADFPADGHCSYELEKRI